MATPDAAAVKAWHARCIQTQQHWYEVLEACQQQYHSNTHRFPAWFHCHRMPGFVTGTLAAGFAEGLARCLRGIDRDVIYDAAVALVGILRVHGYVTEDGSVHAPPLFSTDLSDFHALRQHWRTIVASCDTFGAVTDLVADATLAAILREARGLHAAGCEVVDLFVADQHGLTETEGVALWMALKSRLLQLGTTEAHALLQWLAPLDDASDDTWCASDTAHLRQWIKAHADWLLLPDVVDFVVDTVVAARHEVDQLWER